MIKTTCQCRRLGFDPWVGGRSPTVANGNPLHSFCQDYPLDRGAWEAIVHGVAKSPTGRSMQVHSSDLVLKKITQLGQERPVPIINQQCQELAPTAFLSKC